MEKVVGFTFRSGHDEWGLAGGLCTEYDRKLSWLASSQGHGQTQPRSINNEASCSCSHDRNRTTRVHVTVARVAIGGVVIAERAVKAWYRCRRREGGGGRRSPYRVWPLGRNRRRHV